MFNKVMVLTVSVGAGHNRAAQAVEKALREKGAAREVAVVDALDYMSKAFRTLYQKTYFTVIRKLPDLHRYFFDQLDKPWQKERRRLQFDKVNARAFIKLLENEPPDLIICTHFLPAEIVSWMKAKERLRCPQAIIVTDFDVHAMWLCHHYEHYFVTIEEAKVHLEQLGIPGEKITVSGIPIDSVFSQEKDKRQMRLTHGLDPEKPTILLSAGGWGHGPLEAMLANLTQLRHPAQVVAICGRNEELKQRLDQIAAAVPAESPVVLKPIGFTTEMDEYMSAADILLGATGGLTVSEALAKGLAFVVMNPLRGQEERNSDHLLEQGAAIRCNNLPTLAYKIDTLLDDPARLAAMQASARRISHPQAARTIVETVQAWQ
ncbi:MAG: Processive diacylglycerol beta-glucosyltransferase [Planctomycetes bacterium ADurb.Bin412]|nr:MAG: Processive diacylglycerol beta-glucosyltransferase [Planctomycetes bacterium ADurb.Bin412]